MAYLAASVALLGILCGANLLLTVGVVRRLREHTAKLAAVPDWGQGPGMSVSPGEMVGDFLVTTIDGEPVAREILSGTTLVGFFAPGCPGCEERVPDFAGHARAMGRDQALAVLAGGGPLDDQQPGEASRLIDGLGGSARVVIEDLQGPLTKAFGVSSFPSFALVSDGGTVIAVSADLVSLASLLQPART